MNVIGDHVTAAVVIVVTPGAHAGSGTDKKSSNLFSLEDQKQHCPDYAFEKTNAFFWSVILLVSLSSLPNAKLDYSH